MKTSLEGSRRWLWLVLALALALSAVLASYDLYQPGLFVWLILLAWIVALLLKRRRLAKQRVLKANIVTKCRNCGGLNPVNSPKCEQCGTVFADEETMEYVRTCPKCHTENPSLRSTCLSCGVNFCYTISR